MNTDCRPITNGNGNGGVAQRLTLLTKSIHYLSCGKLKRSAQLMVEAVRHNEDGYDVLGEIISECQRLGLLVQARKQLAKADSLLQQNMPESAYEKYCAISLKGVPTELAFQIIHNKGVCCVALDNLSGAVECFLQAARRVPSDSIALENLSFTYLLLQDYDKALQTFSDVIRIDDIHPNNLLHVLYGAAACRQHLSHQQHQYRQTNGSHSHSNLDHPGQATRLL
jgi:tetratricopeptide (TPR) repeat protein